MTRKESREMAFTMLFEYSFTADSAEELFSIAEEAGIPAADDYCKRVVELAIENVNAIDETIGKYSKGWKPERISKVGLAALRLAVTELRFFDDIPDSVSVNEAVELIKKYATEQDASFANGILGSYLRAGKE